MSKTRKSAKKRALITGINGQDGSYLAEYLLSLDYEVWGLVRRTSQNSFGHIETLIKPPKGVKLIYGNMRDGGTLRAAIEESDPHEIYNLAAQSHVWVSFKSPDETMEINYYGLGRLVHAAMDHNPKIRIYQASTSEMFGKTRPPQSEKSDFQPVSPYGMSKLFAHDDFVKGYREKHGLYICSGILFNHESPRRGENFVTRKITIGLAKVKLGIEKKLVLGNLDAKRDWGFAGEYVKVMHTMLQQKKPEDYVIATGETHTVRQFVEAAAKAIDLSISWSGKGVKEVGKDTKGRIIVEISPEFYRPNEVHYLLGNASKARKQLKWKMETSFVDLVKMMAKADLELFEKLQKAGLA
jgi:GDPmannose 4,6-dehydratase